MRKRRRAIPVELTVELACKKFSPLLDGRGPLPYKEVTGLFKRELAKIDPKMSVKTVERAILEAFQRRWVTVERNGIIPHYRRDARREAKLIEAFDLPHKQLKKVIVADFATPHASVPSNDDVRLRKYSATVHEQLGHSLATDIAASDRLFRPRGDIVSVGSGRAIHAVIDSLRQFPHFKVDEITIMSLTGSLFIHETNVRQEFLLDADIHTALLAQRFDGRVHTLPISQSIAHEPAHVSALKDRTALGKGYESNIPTHAIVGVGVLAPGHRFFEEVKRRESENRERQPNLGRSQLALHRPVTLPESVYADLRWLVARSELINVRREDYFPVADVCNRLFFVPPPDDYDLPPNVEVEITERIGQVNKSLLTITKTQLDKVATVMLVAGTPVKAGAIHQLLVRDIPRIETLCVDSVTADAILQRVARQ